MVEHLHSHAEDETVRISREVIDAIDQRETMQPDEVRVLLPEKAREEQTFFKMGEHSLDEDQDPDLFSFHMNERGEWVLEGSHTEDSWTLPHDVEFNIGGNGAYIRLRGEEAPARPVGRGRLPLVAQRLIASAAKEEAATGNRSRLVLVSHPSEGGKGALLSIKNAGNMTLPLETHQIMLKNEASTVESATPVEANDGEEKDEPLTKEQALAEAEAPQFIDSDSHDETTSDALQNEEIPVLAQKEEVKEPPISRKPLSITARLEGLKEEVEVNNDSGGGDQSEFSSSDLDIRETIDTIAEHISSRFDAMSAASQGVVGRLKDSLPQALRIGHTPAESGVLDALDDMKRIFAEQGEEIGAMAAKIQEYVESEKGVFALNDEVETAKIRQQVVDRLEKLATHLKGMEVANANTLNVHRILDDQLRTIQGPYYPDLPQYEGLSERVADSVYKLTEPLEVKAHEGREVRRLLEELSELQRKL